MPIDDPEHRNPWPRCLPCPKTWTRMEPWGLRLRSLGNTLPWKEHTPTSGPGTYPSRNPHSPGVPVGACLSPRSHTRARRQEGPLPTADSQPCLPGPPRPLTFPAETRAAGPGCPWGAARFLQAREELQEVPLPWGSGRAASDPVPKLDWSAPPSRRCPLPPPSQRRPRQEADRRGMPLLPQTFPARPGVLLRGSGKGPGRRSGSFHLL